MTNSITYNFSPDGMRGSMESGRRMDEDQNASNAAEEAGHTHDYDDGLVHGHAWASSSNER